MGGDVKMDIINYAKIKKVETNLTQHKLDYENVKFSMENEVANGDFSGGTTGWSVINGTFSILDRIGILTGDGTNTTSTISQISKMKRNGQMVYAKAKVRVTNDVCKAIRLNLGGNYTQELIENPIQNEWYELSGIVSTMNDNATYYIGVQQLYVDSTTSAGKVLEIDGNYGILVINLTEIFGAGNEPTKLEMDELMKVIPNGWWDGELTVTQKQIALWQLNLVSKKVNMENELQTQHVIQSLPNYQVADEIAENDSIVKNISEWVVTKPTISVNSVVDTAIWQEEGMTVVSIIKDQFIPPISVIPDQVQYIRAYSPQFVNSGHEFKGAEGQETFAIAKHSSYVFLRVRDEKTGVLSTDDNDIKLAKIQAWLRSNPFKFIYELETPQIIPLPENMTPNTLSIVRLMNMNNWTNAINAAFWKPSTNKAYMTIVDDDGYTNVWTQLKPLSESLGVPFVLAIISSSVEQSNGLTKEQLVELQNLHGWEIASHSHTHANLRVLSKAEIEYELSESKRVLESYGLNIHNFVAPYGSNDDERVRKISSRYYNCGVRVGDGINYKPITNQYVKRVALGAHAGENNTLSYYKSQVDEAKANNGWLIWMTHVGNPTHDATQQQHLNDVILYAQSLGIEIVTLQEGFEAMGNKLEVEGGVTITNDGEIYNSKLEGNLWDVISDISKGLFK